MSSVSDFKPMWRYSWLLLLTFNTPTYGQVADQLSAEKLRCLILNEAPACEQLANWTVDREDHLEYDRIGCLQAHNPKSCYNQGSYLELNGGAAQAQIYFVEGCHLGHAPSCKKANVAGAPDANAKSCVLETTTFPLNGEPPSQTHLEILKTPTSEKCQGFCAAQMRPALEKAGELPMRAACRWGDVELPGASWKKLLVATPPCALVGQDFGDGNGEIFPKCHCVDHFPEQANDLAVPQGLFLAPDAVKIKQIGNTAWYRCVMHLRALASAPADCRTRVNEVKEAFKKAPFTQGFELDAKDVHCSEEVKHDTKK